MLDRREQRLLGPKRASGDRGLVVGDTLVPQGEPLRVRPTAQPCREQGSFAPTGGVEVQSPTGKHQSVVILPVVRQRQLSAVYFRLNDRQEQPIESVVAQRNDLGALCE